MQWGFVIKITDPENNQASGESEEIDARKTISSHFATSLSTPCQRRRDKTERIDVAIGLAKRRTVDLASFWLARYPSVKNSWSGCQYSHRLRMADKGAAKVPMKLYLLN